MPMTGRAGPGRRAAALIGVLAAAVLLVSGVPGTAAADSVAAAKRDAERLRAELAELKERSGQAILRLEQSEHELGVAVARSSALTHELDAARAEAGGSDLQLQRRVSALYRAGGSLGVYASLLRARDPADFAARKVNVDKVVASDARLREVAVDGAGQVAVLEQQAREAAAEKVRATAAAEAHAAEVASLLKEQAIAIERADTRVRDLLEQERRAEQARQLARLIAEQEDAQRARAAEAAARAAALAAAVATSVGSDGGAGSSGVGSGPAGGSGLRGGAGVAIGSDAFLGRAGVCPVGPVHSFTDTWHAPRSGGRKHQGADVFAPYGAPAYAVADGVIERWGNGGLGGITLWLRDDLGNRYYYAHNVSNVAPPGSRVRAGQLIAYVGTTGNAATTPPHIHFEAHPAPGTGGARNPTPWLKALCG
jgi:peptidoglycan LD-endopeptidase LytH